MQQNTGQSTVIIPTALQNKVEDKSILSYSNYCIVYRIPFGTASNKDLKMPNVIAIVFLMTFFFSWPNKKPTLEIND